MAGRKEKMQGKAMELQGEATGDPIRQAEGKAVSTVGQAKDSSAHARENLKSAACKPQSRTKRADRKA